MAELRIFDKKIDTIFDLFGYNENDITKSIAWLFVKCPVFFEKIIRYLFNIDFDYNDVTIKYQVYEKNKGITDLEITDNKYFHIIIEAKRGWNLPTKEQLEKYSERESFRCSLARIKKIVTMSECSNEYAEKNSPLINDKRTKHLSWNTLLELSLQTEKNCNYYEKILLKDFARYIRNIMTTQEKNSNKVYVVSLNNNKKEKASFKSIQGDYFETDITTIEIKDKYLYYFYINGAKTWPKNPPTYIAFRYNSKLQSIHYVENYYITSNLHNLIPEIPDVDLSDVFLVLKLGPAIKPNKEVQTGKNYGRGRFWVDIDTLLTANTIAEAKEISDERYKKTHKF